jgi:hypothetical protein
MVLAHFAIADQSKPSFLTPTHATDGRFISILVCFTNTHFVLLSILGSMDSRGGKEPNHVFRSESW